LPSEKENIEIQIQAWRDVLNSLAEERAVLLRAKEKCKAPGSEFVVPENLLIKLETVHLKINLALDNINRLKGRL
jgi:hypothetical protein